MQEKIFQTSTADAMNEYFIQEFFINYINYGFVTS